MAAPRRLLLIAVLGVAVGVVVATEHAGDGADEDGADGNRFSRVVAFVKHYAARNGVGMMLSDDDIKCLLQVGNASRHEQEHNALVQPLATLYNLVMRTTPRCKLSLLAKTRMFLSVEFAKGVLAALFSLDVTAAAAPTS